MTTKKLYLYLILTFAIGWLCQGMAIMGGLKSGGRTWLLLTMWAPLLAALLIGRDTRGQLWARIKRAGWVLWPLALLIGWSFNGGAQLLLAAFQQGHWNAEFFRLSADGRGIDSIHHLGTVLGPDQQGFGYFSINILLSVALGSVVTMVMGGIGEEGGWRGVLQPEMASRFGALKGTALVGLIWGFWHLPANLAGLNDVQHPLMQSLLIFPLETVCMAFALAWLAKRSGSVWPAALAHAANNVLSSGAILLPDSWLAEQLSNVAASVVIGAVFAWLLAREAGRQ